jgi:membrane associated rhomboid family serine protease
VPASQAAAALAELEAYEADCRTWRVPPWRPAAWQPAHHTTVAIWGTGFTLAFYAWFGPYAAEDRLLAGAAAASEVMRAGEWWRAVSALTVHAGFSHVTGNALCLLFLGHAVCGLFGGGLGWFLMLASGVAGNLAVAFLLRGDHVSVGASTASFGAIGILVAFQTVQMLRRWREWRSIWSPVWAPLGAGIMLLALLGTGPESDLAAHVFGFLFGGLLALPFCVRRQRWFPEWAQRLLELACVLLVLSAWSAVFKHAV